MESSISFTSRHEVEVHKFTWITMAMVPALALIFQTLVPVRFHFFAMFDLPLLVTIFFAVARRNPITGTLTGAAIGTIQDALAGTPIGVMGISNTVVGFVASQVSTKVDVENVGSRVIMIFLFKLLHDLIGFVLQSKVTRPGSEMLYSIRAEIAAAIANALLGVVLFAILDRTKQRR